MIAFTARRLCRAVIAASLVLTALPPAPGAASPPAPPAPTATGVASSPVPSPAPAASHAPVLPVPAGSLPSVETLRAAIAQGGGSDLTRETRVTTFVRGGVAGSTTSYRNGDDERTVETFGPLREQSGRVGGKNWYGNYNGEITIAEAAAGKAAKETGTYRVEAAPAGVDAFVLVRTNLRGDVRRTTVERTTGHVLRIDDVRPNGRESFVYDDFRTTAGDVSPWHWTYRDGQRIDDAEYRIVRLDAGPVAASDLAMPGGRVFVEFPAGTKSVVLPATLRDDKFLVRVTIAGRGLDFVLDTGASTIVMDDAVARELGLTEIARSSDPANAGRFTTTTAIVPEMKVGSLAMHDVAISTIPDFGEEEHGVYKAVGLLGFDFFADTKLTLDYEKGTVTAFDRDGDFSPPLGAKGFVVPVRLGRRSPETDLTINGALGEHFEIDTGAAGAILVFDSFARLHPDALKNDGNGEYPVERFIGVGGEFDTRPYRLKSVRLGRVDFADFFAYRVITKEAYDGFGDGLFGSSFLSLFTIDVDYPDGAIGFAPNAAGRGGLSR